MVTSIASQCCRILFLVGRLYLPLWKAEALASCTSKDKACLCDLVCQMYFSKWKRCMGDVPVHYGMNGRITQTHLLNVEWWGTWHGPRVKLPWNILCTAAWL